MMMGLALLCLTSVAQTIKSPDGKILVFLELKDQGKPYYRVNYQGKEVVTPSVLGLKTNIGDFTQGLALKGVESREVAETYELRNIKQRHVDYRANEAVATYMQKGEPVMVIVCTTRNPIRWATPVVCVSLKVRPVASPCPTVPRPSFVRSRRRW